jgi:hypothetical protein
VAELGKLLIDVLLLRSSAFEHVEENKNFTLYAGGIVLLTAVCLALGSMNLIGWFNFWSIGLAILKWVILAAITHAIGTTLLKTADTHADWGQLARTLGFAQLPGVFYVLGLISPIFILIVLIWQTWASVLAVKAALDYPTKLRAFGVLLIGLVVSGIALTLVNSMIIKFF